MYVTNEHGIFKQETRISRIEEYSLSKIPDYYLEINWLVFPLK